MPQAEIESVQVPSGVLPDLLQLEFHPWVDDRVRQLVGWVRWQGIAVQGYGVLGSAHFDGKFPTLISLLGLKYQDPVRIEFQSSML